MLCPGKTPGRDGLEALLRLPCRETLTGSAQ
jgi:hypothetical protein